MVTVSECTTEQSAETTGNTTKDIETPPVGTPPVEVSTEELLYQRARLLIEYTWPVEGGDNHFVQEQLADFLDVKSFKRKYGDLTRRQMSPAERDFVVKKSDDLSGIGVGMEKGVADIGLTALRSVEVLDLLSRDYPEHLTIKNDEKRLAELRRRAMRCASEWTAEMNRERKKERAQFWDMATMSIQVPRNTYYVASAEETNFGSYPVSLIPRQNAHASKLPPWIDLNTYPMRSVLRTSGVVPKPHRPVSPNQVRVMPHEVPVPPVENVPPTVTDSCQPPINATTSVSNQNSNANVPVKTESGTNLAAADNGGVSAGDKCSQCGYECAQKERWLRCSQCGGLAHASCLDMGLDIYSVCCTYPWQCIDCKPCGICAKLDQEEQMMFCDRCDRGYHTFCVGLDAIPDGRWLCEKFCSNDAGAPRKQDNSTTAASESLPSDVKLEGEPPSKKATPLRRGQQVDFGPCQGCGQVALPDRVKCPEKCKMSCKV